MDTSEKPSQRTFWIYLLISLFSLIIPPIIVTSIDPNMNSEATGTFWEIITKPFPLTTSVIILGTAYLRGWTKRFDFLVHLIFIIVVFFGTAVLFGSMGLDVVPDLSLASGRYGLHPKALPLATVMMTVDSYWNFYGPWNVVCSLVVGSFISWTLTEKLIPHLMDTYFTSKGRV